MSINSGKTFNELEIRDTDNHNGSVIVNGDYVMKTVIIENSLNQIVTLSCEASMHSDFSNSFAVGAPWDHAASKNDYQSCDTYFPYWRMKATCATAPTSGSLTVYILGVRS